MHIEFVEGKVTSVRSFCKMDQFFVRCNGTVFEFGHFFLFF